MDLRKNRILVGVIVLAFVAGVAFTGGIFYASGHNFIKPVLGNGSVVQTGLPGVGANTISEIVKQVGPAVVKIETTSTSSDQQGNPFLNDPFFREFFGNQGTPQQQQQQNLGSGFIISQDGYILTNEHVVEGANQIQVSIAGLNKAVTGKVIGSDRDLDLAVLKVDTGSKLPYLKLGDSDQIAVGNWVIAIGNPYGLDHTVTVGVISAKGRPITVQDRSYRNLLQTDASINPGNSGGPLLNLNGEVIGINTAVSAQAQGIGFVIPSKTVAGVLHDLMTKGKISHGWLGVEIQEVTPSIASGVGLQNTEGVVIKSVLAGGPAEKGGLQAGDIIIGWNNSKVKDTNDLLDKIQQAGPSSKVELAVWHSRHSVTIPLVLGERPATS